MVTEDQILNGPRRGPEWLFSETDIRRKLKEHGLKESAPNADGWTTLVKIDRKPMFPNVLETVILQVPGAVEVIEVVVYDPHRTRKDNSYGPAEKEVTNREQSKVAKHIQSMIRRDK